MITSFQLRAARAVSKITTRELGKIIGISHSTIATLEQTPNLEYLRCSEKTNEFFVSYFEEHDIRFLDKSTISLVRKIPQNINQDKLTVFQYIVARSAAKTFLSNLSRKTRISQSLLIKLAKRDITEYLSCAEKSTYLIRSCFESHGIVFIDNNVVSLISDPEILFEI